MSYKELYTRYQDTVADVEAGVLHEDYIDTAVYAVVDAYCQQHLDLYKFVQMTQDP